MPEKPGYKRFETDEEFTARVKQKHPWWRPYSETREVLDDSVWWNFKMQRRIIEVSP